MTQKSALLIITFFLTFLFSLLSCASPPVPAPWNAYPDALRQHYPDSEYIAMLGRGATRAAAEADGAAAIALFFNTQISSQTLIIEQYREQNGNVDSSTEIASETFVRSQMELFGIRYAEDAYFDRRHREWVTVAYINRAEAWQVYGPRFRQEAEAFRRLLEAAAGESDPFRRAMRYMAAQNYARSADFLNADIFGQLLYPARMNAEAGPVRAEVASLVQRVDDARRNAPVYIDTLLDFESIIRNAFSGRFSAMGFPVSADRNTAAAVCRVTVDEGMQQRQLGIFYFPKLEAEISSPAGTLFSFSADGGQASAVTPDVARRRAYQVLAEKVSNTFSLDVNIF